MIAATLCRLAMASPQDESAASAGRPRVDVPKIEHSPIIDGVVNDRAWSQASRIAGLIEVDPNEGIPAEPLTEILIMRDDDNLYVAFICHEPHIDELVLQDMHRDAWQSEDDAVKITLDTFRDGKTGYYFLISAAGSRLDALIADNSQRLNYRWDGFWEGRTRILTDRWTAEFAIPFKTMAFGSGGGWRANFERWRGVDRSRSRWTGARRAYHVATVSEGGDLKGLDGLHQGMGLEFQPYMKLKRESSHATRTERVVGDLGGEINWQVTPQLNTSLTFNTDFAETEADARRVNLTRFSLFFPEKRDFFLQDAMSFEFGWESGFSGSPEVIPYFSRRIGLAPNGEEIPIEFGARAAGKLDGMSLGVLAVRTGADHSNDVPEGELIVVRPTVDLNDKTTVGWILTSGNPASKNSNVVGGADLRFVSTDMLPGIITFNTYVLRSADEATDELGSAYGLQSTLKTSDWRVSLGTLYTQEAFHPALGFVRRPGERRYEGHVQWEPRPKDSERVRKYGFSLQPSVWSEPNGRIISSNLRTELFEVTWHNGDRFSVDHEFNTDRLESDFEPVDGSVVRAGDYEWQTVGSGFSFSQSRPLSGSVFVEAGEWYDGDAIRLNTSAQWNPSAHLELSLSYSENRIDLPEGDFTTRIETLRVNYDFTSDIRLATLIQADNVSDNLGLQSRFRWIQRDGRELFLVVNASWEEDEQGRIVPRGNDITAKIVYSIRF